MKQERVRAFRVEWNMRENLLLLKGYPAETIAEHRKEILHRYSVTEEDVAVEEDENYE